jgi:hypothetical protein
VLGVYFGMEEGSFLAGLSNDVGVEHGHEMEAPIPPAMINMGVVAVTTREDLEKELFKSFSSRDKEEEVQRKNREKRDRQEKNARVKLALLQEQLAEAPRSTASIERKIEKEEEKLAHLREERRVELELRAMEEQDALKQQPEKEELIQAGLITPFETHVPEESVVGEGVSSVLRRKGTFVDDSNDATYERRIRAWKEGLDLVEEEGEEEEEQAELTRLKQAPVDDENDDDDVDNDDDNDDDGDVGGGNDDDGDVFERDEEVDVFRVVRVEGDCEECLKVRGVKQVMDVLGLRSLSESKFDLLALLKQSRFNPQRVLEQILTEEEAVLREFPYKPCLHGRLLEKKKTGQNKRSIVRNEVAFAEERPKKQKQSAPVAIELPDHVIEEIAAGKQGSVVIEDNFCVPLETYNCLFEYQRTTLRWMWELHKQSVGGILADEMGLGKTVQLISFL